MKDLKTGAFNKQFVYNLIRSSLPIIGLITVCIVFNILTHGSMWNSRKLILNQIYVVMSKIEDKDLVNDINELRSTAVKIVEAVEKAPAKEDKLNTFFNYYLPVTLKILNQYDEIENQGLDTEESINMMKNTKNIIAKIKESFKTDLSRLYESEIIDTEAEIKVFEKMLNSEGFDNIKIKK